MKKQSTVFSTLTAVEMKNIKGGVMPPLFKYNCKRGGVDVLGICYAVVPEVDCGYDQFSCSADGVCGSGSTGGCL